MLKIVGRTLWLLCIHHHRQEKHSLSVVFFLLGCEEQDLFMKRQSTASAAVKMQPCRGFASIRGHCINSLFGMIPSEKGTRRYSCGERDSLGL